MQIETERNILEMQTENKNLNPVYKTKFVTNTFDKTIYKKLEIYKTTEKCEFCGLKFINLGKHIWRCKKKIKLYQNHKPGLEKVIYKIKKDPSSNVSKPFHFENVNSIDDSVDNCTKFYKILV